MNSIGLRARELDEKEIIHRIRIGRRTMFRIFLAVCGWLFVIILMELLL